jgi:pimeloyl-ACP methyl ester carboxylesterase
MPFMTREDVPLYYEEAGEGHPAALLVHAWGGDHTFMAPQLQRLAQSRRAVAVDLRGHGRSGKPRGDYTLDTFSQDLLFLCEELCVSRPVIVGHSLGGMIAMDLVGRAPGLASALILLDSPVVAPPGLVEGFRAVVEPLGGPGFADVMRDFIATFVGFDDSPAMRESILRSMVANDQHAMVSSLAHCLDADTAAAAARCTVPLLYVSSGPWYTDVAALRTLCPQVITGQTVGSGHFHQLEVPEQINAMIERFLAVRGL